MVDMCVEIETSRAIAAQILRHKSFSFQEFSQRYSEVPGCEPIELRLKAEKNRQSSSEVTNEYDRFVDEVVRDTFRLYEFLVQKGVSKETARMILPLGTSTRMYMKGSVRSWIHYFMVRLNKDTQKEHLDVAFEVFQIFSEQFPKISDLLIQKKYIDI
jgi:thymidylate synthase (FAD)